MPPQAQWELGGGVPSPSFVRAELHEKGRHRRGQRLGKDVTVAQEAPVQSEGASPPFHPRALEMPGELLPQRPAKAPEKSEDFCFGLHLVCRTTE